MASKKRRPTTLSLVLIGLLSVSGVAALTNYVQTTASRVPSSEHRNSNPGKKPLSAPKVEVESRRSDTPEHATISVFKPKFSGEELTFEASSKQVPAGEDARIFAVTEFLSVSKVLPEGARLLALSVHGGVASVSFNSKIRGSYGSDDERVLVNGLMSVLGQFKDIERVEFFADGERIDSFGGHLDVSEPQLVTRSSTTNASKPKVQP